MKDAKNRKYIYDISVMTGIEEKKVEAVFKAYRLLLLHYIATEQAEDGSVTVLFPNFIPFKFSRGKKDKVVIKVPMWVKHKYLDQIKEALFDKHDFLNDTLLEAYTKDLIDKIGAELNADRR